MQRRDLVNLMRGMCKISTSSILINTKKLYAFPFRSGKKIGPSTPILNISVEVLTIAVQKEKEIKEERT